MCRFSGKILKGGDFLKILRIISRVVFCISLIASILIFSLIFILGSQISQEYKINSPGELDLNTKIPVTAVYNGYDNSAQDTGSYRVDLKIFGVIPFSSTTVKVVDKMQVAVLGTPFGIKLYTDGVLVVDIKGVETENGIKQAAKSAGLMVGDYINSVNGYKILSNEDLAGLVENSGGKELVLSVRRSNKTKTVKIRPVLESGSGKYRVGIWVRDSSAGIGTLTFYSPYSNVICGLGHEISDVDTNKKLDISSGEIVGADIISVKKGKSGEAGELIGKFGYNVISNDLSNEENGIYGLLKGNIGLSSLCEVALKQNVKSGAAQILTTVKGNTPALYSCKIYLLPDAFKSKTQNFVVTVTDKKLLDETGGIVQGMSGSPIIQDGKLIGAVTHVFLDDSSKGYGIFAENMLDTANQTAKEYQEKKAS